MPATSIQTSSQSASSAGVTDCLVINEEFVSMLSPLHCELSNNIVSPSVAVEEFVSLLNPHLEHYSVNNHSLDPSLSLSNHRECSIVHPTKTLAKFKNQSRQTFSTSPGESLSAVRAHNKAKKAMDHHNSQRSMRKQEKAFKRNPWKFSKSVCEDKPDTLPSFSLTTCHKYFESIYSKSKITYNGLPDWVHNVMPVPDITEEFDMSPVTPRLIKHTLQKCSANSSPGPDKITYIHLRNLPSTHYFYQLCLLKFLRILMKFLPHGFKRKLF